MSAQSKTSGYDPTCRPQAGQNFAALPAQLDSAQVRAWLGLSRDQWFAVRSRRELKRAVVWGTAGPGLRFWTARLAPLVPAEEANRRATSKEGGLAA